VPVFNSGSVTAAIIAQGAVARLTALRRALEDCADFRAWLSGMSTTDLTNVGFSSADASSLQSAFADANELSVLFNGGALGTYTLPYNFSSSIRLIIGPG
jgi:hypothetical protein